MTTGEHVFVATTVILGLAFAVLLGWALFIRKQRDCMHHERGKAGQSWIYERLIDAGRRKMFTCTHCYQRWFTP